MAVPEIGPAELQQRLTSGAPPVVLDVRESWECAIVRLPDTVHIPLGEVPERWRELDPNAALVVMCHSGGRSRRAAEFLQSKGFAKVTNLTGGIDAWTREIDPSLASY
jgi:sulfur-carrier protein adenylyltransferase/sulfurtransferase